MGSTQQTRKYKKPNWKYVEIGKRDIALFRAIREQKFLTRMHVIEHVFGNSKSYAEIRIRKLKRFGYLKALKVLANEPECYLLGEGGVEALEEADQAEEEGSGNYPAPQDSIEIASYDHDKKVTNVRFLFQGLGFCKDWKSEKMLRVGTKGERKVPDGLFSRNGKGIAIEVELNDKKPETYRKIFRLYDQNSRTHYVFYICSSLSLLRKIMPLTRGIISKHVCFILYDELMEFREKAIVHTHKGNFQLKEVLG